MSERVIQVGEDFQVYPMGTEIEHIESFRGGEPFDRIINLEVDELLIPFHFFAHPARFNGLDLTPFKPEIGYIFDHRDFNKESRLEKVKAIDSKLSEEERQNVEIDAPLVQHVIGNFKKANSRSLQLPAKLLIPLRLRLQFPESSYESMANIPSIDFASDGDAVHYSGFYPVETGPMHEVWVEEYDESGRGTKFDETPYNVGHEVHLPSNLDKLAQIIGKFVVVPERLLLAQLMNLPEYFNRYIKG